MESRGWVLVALGLGACGGASEVAPASGGGMESESGSTSVASASGPSSSATSAGGATTASTTDSSTTAPSSSGTTTMIDVETESGSTTDAGTTGSVTAGTTGSPVCTGIFWELDFDADPTAQDVNADTIADWTLRDGSVFPVGELAGGVWTAGTHQPLDTRPVDDFTVRTRVQLEMRSLQAGSTLGATFWINVDYAGGTFAPIYVHLNLDDSGTQDLQLFGKTDNATPQLLAEVLDLPDAFITVELDIDPAADDVQLWVDGNDQGTFAYPTFAPQNTDRWATVFAWETDAAFRHVRIEQCP